MGELQDRNLATAKAFYGAGPAATDDERRTMFAEHFVWHVPGDTDLSGPYADEDYFTSMPQRMQPLDAWSIELQHLAANADLVIAVGRIQGRRRNQTVDEVGGHVLRFDDDSRIIETWGWCAQQSNLDAFFAEP